MKLRDWHELQGKSIPRQYRYVSILANAIKTKDTNLQEGFDIIKDHADTINRYLNDSPLLLLHPQFSTVQSYFTNLIAVNNPEDMNQVHDVSYKGMRKYIQENILDKHPLPEDAGILSEAIDEILRDQDCTAETKQYLPWLKEKLRESPSLTAPRTMYQAYSYIKEQKPGSKESLMSQFLQALDDSAKAYETWDKKFWDGLDYSCHPGLEDRIHDIFIPTLNSLPISEQPPIIQATQYLQQYTSLLVNTADPDEMTLNAKAMVLVKQCLEDKAVNISDYQETSTKKIPVNIVHLFNHFYEKEENEAQYKLRQIEECPSLPSVDKVALYHHLQNLPPIKRSADLFTYLQKNPFEYEVQITEFKEDKLTDLTDLVITAMYKNLGKLAESDYIDLVFTSPTQANREVLHSIVAEIIREELYEIDSGKAPRGIDPNAELESIHRITKSIIDAQLMKLNTPGSELEIEEPVRIAYVDISEESKAEIIRAIDDRFPGISTFERIDKLLKMGYHTFTGVLVEQDGFIEGLKSYIDEKATEIEENQPNITTVNPLSSAANYKQYDILLKVMQKLIDSDQSLAGKILEIAPNALIEAITYNITDISELLLKNIDSLSSTFMAHPSAREILQYTILHKNPAMVQDILAKLSEEDKFTLLSVLSEENYPALAGAILNNDTETIDILMKEINQLPKKQRDKALETEQMELTPLMAAASIDNYELMAVIFDNLSSDEVRTQALLNTDDYGASVITWTLENPNAARFIFEKITNIEPEARTQILQHPTHDSNSILISAIKNRKTDCTRGLLAIIKNLDTENIEKVLSIRYKRMSALDYAIAYQQEESFETIMDLIAELPPELRTQYYTSAFQIALSTNNDGMQKTLFDAIKSLPSELRIQALIQDGDNKINILTFAINQSPKYAIEFLDIIQTAKPEEIIKLLASPNSLNGTPILTAVQVAMQNPSILTNIAELVETLPLDDQAEILTHMDQRVGNALANAAFYGGGSAIDRVASMIEKLSPDVQAEIITQMGPARFTPIGMAASSSKPMVFDAILNIVKKLPKKQRAEILMHESLESKSLLYFAISSSEFKHTDAVLNLMEGLPLKERAQVLTQSIGKDEYLLYYVASTENIEKTTKIRIVANILDLIKDKDTYKYPNMLKDILKLFNEEGLDDHRKEAFTNQPPTLLTYAVSSGNIDSIKIAIDAIKEFSYEIKVQELLNVLGPAKATENKELIDTVLSISEDFTLEQKLEILTHITEDGENILSYSLTHTPPEMVYNNLPLLLTYKATYDRQADTTILEIIETLSDKEKEAVLKALTQPTRSARNSSRYIDKETKTKIAGKLTSVLTSEAIYETPERLKGILNAITMLKPEDKKNILVRTNDDPLQNSPLILAVASNNIESIKALLNTISQLPANMQAEVLSQDNAVGIDALSLAIEENNEECINAILSIIKALPAKDKNNVFTHRTRIFEKIKNMQNPGIQLELVIQLQEVQSSSEVTKDANLATPINEILAKMIEYPTKLLQIFREPNGNHEQNILMNALEAKNDKYLVAILNIINQLPKEMRYTILSQQNYSGENTLTYAVKYSNSSTSVQAIIHAIKNLPKNMQKEILMQQDAYKDTALILAIDARDNDNNVTAILETIGKLPPESQEEIFLQQDNTDTPLFTKAVWNYAPAILETLSKLPEDIQKTILTSPDALEYNAFMAATTSGYLVSAKSIAQAISQLDPQIQKSILLTKDEDGDTFLDELCFLQDSESAEPLLKGKLTDKDWQELFTTPGAVHSSITSSSTTSTNPFIQKCIEVTTHRSATAIVTDHLTNSDRSSAGETISSEKTTRAAPS